MTTVLNRKLIASFIAVLFVTLSSLAEECPSWRNKTTHPQCPITSLEEYNSYSGYFGKSKNTKKQKEILQKAYQDGEDWAKACKAVDLEKIEPKKSFELYAEFAIKNECAAQTYLAEAFYKGKKHVKKNLEKAYFWLLLSDSQHKNVTTTSIISFEGCSGLVFSPRKYCPRSSLKIGLLEKQLKMKSVESIQDFASNWSIGDSVDTFFEELAQKNSVKIAHSASKATIKTPDPVISKLDNSVFEDEDLEEKWLALPVENFKDALSNKELDATAVFELSAPAVWTVYAVNSKKDIKLGSAVAVNENTLLTNCHVVSNHKNIAIMQGEKMNLVKIKAANIKNDTCTLETSFIADKLSHVKGLKKYSKLKVGEDVYSIGSPKGLEATLGKGIISGLRKRDAVRLIQISAPISSGSSGGGIFDKYGNLIGISTFQLKDSQNMNFSISVEDYFKP